MPVADESNRELQLLEPNDFDEAELTPAQSRAALLTWYLLLLISAVVIAAALALTMTMQAGAVELSISGSSSGSGNQSLFFVGYNLTAFWNGTAWTITAVTP